MKKNIFKNRTILGIICIVFSLVICFLLTPIFIGSVKSQVDIVRVTKDIEKGTLITKDMTTIVTVGGYNLPLDVVKSEDEVVGMYAKGDFVVGDYILSRKLSSEPLTEFSYLTELDGNKQAISITIKSFASGLSGKLEANDVVRIIGTDVGDFRETISPPELQYVKVIAVTDGNGYDKEYNKNTNEDKELPSTITLLVNREQAEILAELESRSKIHCTLIFRGGIDKANAFLEVQDNYLQGKDSINTEEVLELQEVEDLEENNSDSVDSEEVLNDE